ncbi:MAG: hypothetical protein ACRBF0_12800 [Calditrichia bacterium]
MRWLIPLTIVLFGSCSSVKQQIDPEDPWSSSFYPFTLNSIEAACVDTLYGISATVLRSYPGRRIQGPIEGYVFEVCFSISSPQPDIIWDQPFFVEVELPNGESVDYILNDEGGVLSGGLQHDFVVLVESTEDGRSRMTLGFLDITNDVDYDSSNPFQSQQFRLE